MEVATSGGGLVHEESNEIVKPDVIDEINDENWDLEGIITVVEVEANEQRGRMRALR